MSFSKKCNFLGLFFILFFGCSPLGNQGKGPQLKIQNHLTEVGSPGSFPSLGLSFLLTTSESPLRVDRIYSYRLVFWREGDGNAAGPWVDPVLIPVIKLWMRMPSGDGHSGIGGVDGVTLTLQSPGEYTAEGIGFTMTSRRSGDWEFHIQLKNSQGEIIQEVVQTTTITDE